MVKETGQVEDGGMGEGEGVGPRSATTGAAWSGIARPVAGPTKARSFKAGGAFLILRAAYAHAIQRGASPRPIGCYSSAECRRRRGWGYGPQGTADASARQLPLALVRASASRLAAPTL